MKPITKQKSKLSEYCNLKCTLRLFVCQAKLNKKLSQKYIYRFIGYVSDEYLQSQE